MQRGPGDLGPEIGMRVEGPECIGQFGEGRPHLLGAYMIAASLIPIGDMVIVLRSGGTRAAAYGIHGTTAAVALAAGLVLLLA
ncbi:hypothetical protein BH11PSE6_BH11PSE6_22920 [soil metagenome]